MEKWLQILIKVGGGVAALSVATIAPDKDHDAKNSALILTGTTLIGSALNDVVSLLTQEKHRGEAV